MKTLVNQNGRHHSDNVDGLLRRFFRAQMPEPWPTLDLPAPAPVARRFAFMQGLSRLALAASILIMAAGYVALGGLFPEEQPSPTMEVLHPGTIGKRVKTNLGNDALIQEQVVPGNPGERPITIINVQGHN